MINMIVPRKFVVEPKHWKWKVSLPIILFSDRFYNWNARGGERWNIGVDKEARFSLVSRWALWRVQNHPRFNFSQSGEMLSNGSRDSLKRKYKSKKYKQKCRFKWQSKNTNKCRFKYKTSLQVDKTNYNGECKGNLLHHAICFGSKRTEYVATRVFHKRHFEKK